MKLNRMFFSVKTLIIISFSYDPIIPLEIPPAEIKPTMKFHVPLQL